MKSGKGTAQQQSLFHALSAVRVTVFRAVSQVHPHSKASLTTLFPLPALEKPAKSAVEAPEIYFLSKYFALSDLKIYWYLPEKKVLSSKITPPGG